MLKKFHGRDVVSNTNYPHKNINNLVKCLDIHMMEEPVLQSWS